MSITLGDNEKKILLADAKEAISAELEKRAPKFMQDEASSGALEECCGAFVTLHGENNALRGCIGRMSSDMPLRETVRITACAAAFDDLRFPSLGAGEWPLCSLEISVLTPMEICNDPESVKVGVHGLYLVHDGHSGVLLPQVPVEQGWSRQEYLDAICGKAGLPKGSYSAPGAKLYTFTAIVFGP